MKICGRCRKEIASDAISCPHCGAKFKLAGSKICGKCQKTVSSDATSCPYCGVRFKAVTAPLPTPTATTAASSPVVAAPSISTKNLVPSEAQSTNNVPSGNASPANDNVSADREKFKRISRRSVLLCIFLSIITCGIYGTYWYMCLTDEMNRASGRVNDASGGVSWLFTAITCSIYQFFWAYRMGVKRDIVANKGGSSCVLYLILTFCCLGWLVCPLVQHTLNKAIDR